MAQEFTINSSAIESKINQLLPSQGGFGAGVDFSASTMVIPIVDLTETAEGSDVREDLQTALSLSSCTAFNITGSAQSIVTTTGWFRCFGDAAIINGGSPVVESSFAVTDGTTTKILAKYGGVISGSVHTVQVIPFDFIVKLQAGDSLIGNINTSGSGYLTGVTRQLADLSGNLIDP